MAESKPKPLSFSTTIRNPERIPAFLKCILPFEGQILTSEIIHKVLKNILREKIYRTNFQFRNEDLKEIYYSEEKSYTDKQLNFIIENSPQSHKEAGFEKGWNSRFDTWYKILKEFGFINYSMNKKIVITLTGHMLVDAYNENPKNSGKIQAVFLNALMKYQTDNPLRKNSNDNAPLPLLLNVIMYLRNDPEESDAGIAKNELPILICWRNNDAYEAYQYIKRIRKKHRFKCSMESIYEYCLEILESSNTKYYKYEKICFESVDEYIRKMRMTGLISLRGNGRFLDINSFESETAAYVIEKYSSYKKFDDIDTYIEYMGEIDSRVVCLTSESIDHLDIKTDTLNKYARENTVDFVNNELLRVCSRKPSKDDFLKYIEGPTRLEFLTSVALVQNFEGLKVEPNYIVDDEGFPIKTAGGGLADIECFDDDSDSYFEVSLMCGRTDQVNNEIIPISRHLKEAINSRREESFAVFVAPSIHSDTRESADWQKFKYGLEILPLDINEFVEKISSSKKVSELLSAD